MQVEDTQAKLDDIEDYVETSIASSCQCEFRDANLFAGEFRCSGSLPITSVVYRANLRGFDTTAGDCTRLVNLLDMAIDSNQSISVVNEDLTLLTNCAVSVSSFDAEVRCMDGEDDGLGIAVIAGVAAGGGVILLIILTITVVFLVLCGILIKKRRDRRISTRAE